MTALLRLAADKGNFPAFVCLTETFLDKSTSKVHLEGYTEVARRDRSDNSGWGGVLVFARNDVADSVVLLERSATEERVWLVLHSDQGPYLFGVWYRAPAPGETTGVTTFREEYCKHREGTLGSLVVGDFNVHQRQWLVHSAKNTPEGKALEDTCRDEGLKQLVREPTREEYLLDLVLTDLDGVKCKVLPGVADHQLVQATLVLPMPKVEEVQRQVWDFAKGNWAAVRQDLAETDWDCLLEKDADEAAAFFNARLLQTLERHVPRRFLKERKSTHPWLTEEVLLLVKAKQEAKGLPGEQAAAKACSEGVLAAYTAYVLRVKRELSELPRGSRKWWTKSKELLELKGKTCSVPALKNTKGAWVTSPADKAQLLAETFGSKYTLEAGDLNEYTALENLPCEEENWTLPSEEQAEKTLKALRPESATGPDGVPTRLLQSCARELAKPLVLLARRALETGRWPKEWVTHWILPLYKKKSPWDPGNYRGVHLTSQGGKTVERLLQLGFGTYLSSEECAGENQFAYRKERGARDLLALLVLTWLQGFDQGRKFCLYCSDVSGAFDRVKTTRLTKKLQALGVPQRWVQLFVSWLRERQAQVVVGGTYSALMALKDMVFQGTVWGPVLWNVFYQDARKPVRDAGFTEEVYADDLNAYKSFPLSVANSTALKEGKNCQAKLHKWGSANHVSFDPKKESFHVLARAGGEGGNTELLGVNFDTALTMADAVRDTVVEVGWKLRTLRRSARYHTDAALLDLYKCRVLSYLEYRTPAVYHATNTVLQPLDKLQERFVHETGVSTLEALMVFNLAPLSTRRDIAMLGLVHRTVLGKGPKHFQKFFTLEEKLPHARTRLGKKREEHGRQLRDPRARTHLNVVRRSALGLVAVYNLLPAKVVQLQEVKDFQRALQELVKERACANCENWHLTLSPRLALHNHPLTNT